MFGDVFGNRVDIRDDLIVGVPHDVVDGLTQISFALLILIGPTDVGQAVDFNHQFRIGTIEVDDVPADRMLLAKLPSAQLFWTSGDSRAGVRETSSLAATREHVGFTMA